MSENGRDTTEPIQLFKDSVGFKAGQQFERHRIIEILRFRQGCLKDFRVAKYERNARVAIQEIERTIEAIEISGTE